MYLNDINMTIKELTDLGFEVQVREASFENNRAVVYCWRTDRGWYTMGGEIPSFLEENEDITWEYKGEKVGCYITKVYEMHDGDCICCIGEFGYY